MKRIQEMRWEEIRQAAAGGATVVVPTASMEQHGTHLAVRTDTTLVTAVVEGAVATLEDVDLVVAPTLWLGSSNHHLPYFAITIDETTYIEVVTQVAVSLATARFKRLIFVNGHGGNSAPLRVAVNQIRRRRPDLLVAAADYWSLAADAIRAIRTTGAGGVGHAGEFETSLMMHLAPDAVTLGREKPSIPNYPAGQVRDLTERGTVAVGIEWDALSRDGTLGDPTQASQEKGERFYAAVVQGTAAAIKTFARMDPTSLRPEE